MRIDELAAELRKVAATPPQEQSLWDCTIAATAADYLELFDACGRFENMEEWSKDEHMVYMLKENLKQTEEIVFLYGLLGKCLPHIKADKRLRERIIEAVTGDK